MSVQVLVITLITETDYKQQRINLLILNYLILIGKNDKSLNSEINFE